MNTSIRRKIPKEFFEQAAAEGRSRKELADQIGCTPENICRYLKSYNLDLPRDRSGPQHPVLIPRYDREWYEARIAEGLSARKIAEVGDIKVVTVYKWMRLLDLRPSPSPEVLAEERLARAAQHSEAMLARSPFGGIRIRRGYREILSGPICARQYVPEHRSVAESAMGRPLTTDEKVHHVDQNKLNNDPTNLLVLGVLAHGKLHAAMADYPDLDQRAWLKVCGFPFIDIGTLVHA